ncbi:MAG: phage integrase [Gammaproteobacteria bacterium]|nr:phage integrase [Gammaproteobacteria bacterium]
MAQITTIALRSAWRGKDRWLSDGGARGAGRLVARITRDGVAFLYQYFAPDGRKRFYPLGPYDAQGQRGLSLPGARDRASELSALYRSGARDLHAHFEEQRNEEERIRKAAREAELRTQAEAERGTLQQLLATYTDHLQALGKSSVKDVRNIFQNHVLEAAPHLARCKATAVSVDDFVDLIGRVVAARKGRTAAKLRSYLRAAYSLAIKSRTDPAAPGVLKSFGIVTNPMASIGALSKFSRTRTRHLTAPELTAFLRRVEALPASPKKDAVDLCLSLGGQRPTQLLRARVSDLDLTAGTITLYDPKGARHEPRVHVIPVTQPAASILQRRLDAVPDAGNGPLFSADQCTPMRLETLSAFVSDLSAEMVGAKETREPFQLRDLRRTLETLLASLKVSRDIRSQVQSHGLGGVQQRHYDRHEYFEEKRATLELLAAHLERLRAGDSVSSRPLTPAIATRDLQPAT